MSSSILTDIRSNEGEVTMWEIIRETSGALFEVRSGGVIVDTAPTYEVALGKLGSLVSSALVALAAAGAGPESGDGLLPERWVNVEGIAMSEPTGDGRDFSNVKWSSRDPNVSTMPLMLSTTNQGGHFGAAWVGFMDSFKVKDGTPQASGRFYDSPLGVQARDMMLSRPVGVSVDPGAVDAEFTCTESDEWGFCVDGETTFTAYEVIGLTITPFPAFARAAIQLEGAQASTAAAIERAAEAIEAFSDAVTAAAIEIPEILPADGFRMPEPGLGDPLLVRQPPQFEGDPVEHWAVPLTVTDDGRVFGHAARSGQCHVGIRGECVTAPMSATGYAFFHLGVTRTDEGDLSTGVLIAGCNHYPTTGRTNGAAAAHYDNTGLQWADVRASNGRFGVWVCGWLRPGITDAQLRVIRASGLSGDWEERGGNLEMIAAQCVNVPGFPILREWLAASGLELPVVHGPSTRTVGGRLVALSAAGLVQRPCPDCEARRATQIGVTGRMDLGRIIDRLARMETVLLRLDQRTAPLRSTAAERLRARIASTID